jgi:Tfp pilus assembly protein PilN
MINLLPPIEKENVVIVQKKKIIIVLGSVVLISLFCFSLILLAIYFQALSSYQEYNSALTLLDKENIDSNKETTLNNIKKYNETINSLNLFLKNELYVSDVLQTIDKMPTPDSVYITNFTLDRDTQKMISVNLSGISDSRNSLILFKKNIENDSDVKNPVFLPESWIKLNNVDFNLNFVYEKR